MLPDPSQPLNLRPINNPDSSSSSSSSTPKQTPIPRNVKPTAKGGLKPEFKFAQSKDGDPRNIMIMLHGTGDTEQPFFELARRWSLPNTSILSLRGPYQVPLMDGPSFSYLPISPLHYLSPEPPATPTTEQLSTLHTQLIPLLRNLLTYLSVECGYPLESIHLFGWGEGGTIGLELGKNVGSDPIDLGGGVMGKRLGSIVSISGEIYSTPPVGSNPTNYPTPVLFFHRPRPTTTTTTTTTSHPNLLARIFSNPQTIPASFSPRSASTHEKGQDIRMPCNEDEWKGLMKFWSEVLVRPGMRMGGGEVFEVVR